VHYLGDRDYKTFQKAEDCKPYGEDIESENWTVLVAFKRERWRDCKILWNMTSDKYCGKTCIGAAGWCTDQEVSNLKEQ
jgi:hypothetical protein